MPFIHLRKNILFTLIALLVLCVPLIAASEDEAVVYLPAIFHHYQADTWDWSAPETIEFSSGLRASASNIDAQGNLVLLWQPYTSPYFIYYTVLSAGGWSEPRPVAEPLGSSSLIAPPFADAQGNLHLVWKTDLGSGNSNRYRLNYARWDGDKWHAEPDIYQSSKTPRMVAITHDEAMQPVIAFTLDSSYGSIERLERSGYGWQSLSPLELNISLISGIWPDRYRRLHILATRGLLPAELVYSLWEDEQFTVLNEPIGGNLVIGPNDVFDWQGNFHRVWRGTVPVPGGTVMGAYHKCMDTNLIWHDQSILTGDHSVSDLLVMGPTGDSPFAVAWTESGVLHPQIKIWDGCALQQQQPVTTITSGDLISLTYRGDRLCVLARSDYQSGYSETCATVRQPGATE